MFIRDSVTVLLDEAFDALVLAVPAPQAVPLLAPHSPALAGLAALARMRAAWALMLRYDAPLDLHFDAAFVNHGPLRWVARDSHKPGRGPGETWLLHATPQWSEAHLEDTPEAVSDALTRTLGARVPLLGQIPLDTRLREAGDAGAPIVLADPDTGAGQALAKIAAGLATRQRGLSGMSLGLTPVKH